jgi:multidrug efflux pump subunit AcrB
VLEDHSDAPAQRGDGLIDGIVVATLLTLLFLPALYVAWYKFREPKKDAQ